MKIIREPLALKEYLQTVHTTLGFVPTMGALHEGHLSLIQKAKAENDCVVVSIFVNPTQFLQGEDLDSYPKKEAADTKICELAGVDVLFMPNASSMYENDEVTLQAPHVRGYVLEGASRPGHFSGVLTVVMKLLNIVSPTRAYFGKKDAQQLHLIRLMVKNLYMNVHIVAVDTVRESDGLAMSSRNVYLSKEEHQEALKISASLKTATNLVMQKNFSVKEIKAAMHQTLAPLEVVYVEILNRDFEPLQVLEVGNSVILVEALVGRTRLLDNIWL